MNDEAELCQSEPHKMIVPGRKITGMSAILLPLLSPKTVDWDALSDHLARTFDAPLVPAVNMDTGYINLIDDKTRRAVLSQTHAIATGRDFAAGVFVKDQAGAPLDFDAYRDRLLEVVEHGGTPVVFQSYGLTELPKEQIVEFYRRIAELGHDFIAFELGPQFAGFGKIYDLETYRHLLLTDKCIGAKHSSLSRELEWKRLELRDRMRPDFLVLTGNDLAIDMVKYGSDYLLGLSTFAPDLFALRDNFWTAGDRRFYELNDVLQFLGCFAFRAPVPAYKHSAAQFLHLRSWSTTDHTFEGSPQRPESDIPVLRQILHRLEEFL